MAYIRSSLLRFSAFILVVTSAVAQTAPSSAISGQVLDGSGAAIVGADIEVRQLHGPSDTHVLSDSGGCFSVSHLFPDTYEIHIGHAGFRELVQTTDLKAGSGIALTLQLEPASVGQTIDVTTERLTEVVETSSRLGLTPLETPVSISSLSSDTMARRGYEQVEDAIQSMPGVSSGGSPEAPSAFVVRGFVGNQVLVLRDGIYTGPAGMITRPENTFNLQSVQVLAGPSSVIYGQGAVGGTINEITKPALFTPIGYEGYAAYGSFNTYVLGLGAGGQISHQVAFRSDLSYYSTDGFVEGSHSHVVNGTASLLWKPRADFSAKVALDARADVLPSYYGTPYVPASFTSQPLRGVVQTSNGTVLDGRMRYKNYNVADNEANSETFLPTVTLLWQPLPSLTLTNETYFYHATRNWENAETYTFLGPNSGAVDANGNPIPGNVIARDRFHVFHEQNLPGNSLNVLWTRNLFRLNNRLSGGFENYNISFVRSRSFPNATFADYVDPLNPVRGSYGNFSGDFPSRVSPTVLNDKAGFFEDALDLTHRLTLVTGIRFENVLLNRMNYSQTGTFQSSTSFEQSYHPVNYRAGVVYGLTSFLTAYGQFSTGQDPPGSSNIFVVNASQNFTLSSSTEGEVGLKSLLPRGLGEATLALYNIDRKNILTQTAQDVVSNVGSQKSRGVEFSTTLHPSRLVSLSFNTAYTDARYGYFLDTSSGASYNGNRPPDVPSTTTNLWASVQRVSRLPLELGGGLRFVGDRFADNANQTKLLNYATVDVYGTYRLTERLMITARGNNLCNKAYVQWADTTYPTEAVLGAPRSFEVSLRSHF